MATRPGVTRRDFIRASALTLAGVSLLSACAPTAPASKPAETKPAAPAKPAAAAPTTAPAAAKPAAPAKPAETAKPAAAAAPAKPGPKIGAQLIGKLEGPTVITDPAQSPKSFKEAPA